ncbi:MAG TPA: hypothetical protein VEP48_06305 [Methylomirabilota bacterium]|nr:hypothetical protein [Methylomirabilota bacterium]
MKNWFSILRSSTGRTTTPQKNLPYTLVYRASPFQPIAQSVEITPYAEASVWFLDSVNEVARLSNLPEGWDSNGSPSVTPKAKAVAVRLLMNCAYKPLPEPHLGAVPGGGLQLEWSYGPKCLELEVFPDGTVQFLTVDDEKTMVEGVLQPNHTGQIRNHVGWVTA